MKSSTFDLGKSSDPLHDYLGPPVVPFYPLGEGSPTKIDYRKKGTLIQTSLLEDLVTVDPGLGDSTNHFPTSEQIQSGQAQNAPPENGMVFLLVSLHKSDTTPKKTPEERHQKKTIPTTPTNQLQPPQNRDTHHAPKEDGAQSTAKKNNQQQKQHGNDDWTRLWNLLVRGFRVPVSPRAYLARARAHFEKGRVEAALRVLDEADEDAEARAGRVVGAGRSRDR